MNWWQWKKRKLNAWIINNMLAPVFYVEERNQCCSIFNGGYHCTREKGHEGQHVCCLRSDREANVFEVERTQP